MGNCASDAAPATGNTPTKQAENTTTQENSKTMNDSQEEKSTTKDAATTTTAAATTAPATTTTTDEKKEDTTPDNTMTDEVTPEAEKTAVEATTTAAAPAATAAAEEPQPTTAQDNKPEPSKTMLSREASKSSMLDPVDLDRQAPAPTTQSPHALPRTQEDEDLGKDSKIQEEIKPFRNGVAKVLYNRRIWSRLASELDAAEEGDLLNKVEFNKTFGQSAQEEKEQAILDEFNTTEGGESAPNAAQVENSQSTNPTHRAKAINTPKLTGKERLTKRRVYEKHVRDYQIAPIDQYPEAEYASDEFLWLLTYSQHKARSGIAKHPVGKGAVLNKNGRQFDIAQVPQLADDTPLTQDWIDTMIAEFRKGKSLSFNDAFQICRRAVVTMLPEKNCVELKVPKDAICTVVGDLHGQLDDLLMIFREAGHPGPNNRMLFNGDFVDRGAYSCEVVLILLAYRALYPRYVFLNKGNHECSDMNAFDGFQKEVELKYNLDLYWFFNHVFATLPIAHLITVGHQRVFVVHAGLSFEDFTIDEMNAENRYLTSFPMNTILQDLLWSDPYDGIGRQMSRRGAGCQFGIDVVQRFLIKNSIHLIIRSHECEDNGFALWFENRLYTIFSCSNYCGNEGNYGAFCVLSNAPSPQIRVYSAKQQVIKYSERQLQTQQASLSKLLVRIASRIYEIEKLLKDIAQKRGTPGFVPPFAWSFALLEVLGLDCAFLPIATKLGVNVDYQGGYISPDKLKTNHADSTYVVPYSDDDRATRQLSFIKTEGEVAKCNMVHPETQKVDKVLIDIDAWTSKFKSEDLDPTDLRGHIAALLYDTTSPFLSGLEKLFKHFDVNGDGFITPDELSDGLMKILAYLKIDESLLTPDNIDDLIASVDINNDGEIDYNEFFRAFAYGQLKIDDKLTEDS